MLTTTVIPKIKSISELEKLYKINIPVYEHFDYYIETLLKSKEFEFLTEAIENIFDLENYLEELQSTSVGNYKMKKLDELVKYIKGTNTYKNFQEYDLKKLPPWKSKDERTIHFLKPEKHTFVSFDLPSANFLSMTYGFDTSKELYGSWSDLCKKFNIHPAVKNSKSFRQYVFGNINPKRCQTIQQGMITNTINMISSYINMDSLIYISSDELIFIVEKEDEKGVRNLKDIFAEKDLRNRYIIPYRFNPTVFNIAPVEEKSTKIFVKVILDESLGVKYKQLVGCPGNQMFIYFKKYILNEPIDERDLLFKSDGKLAKWIV